MRSAISSCPDPGKRESPQRPRTANKQFLWASRQLSDANGKISLLTSTLLQANQQIAELKANMERYNHESRKRAEVVEQKIDQLRSGSSDDIPVTVP
jgi:hypothetical protein